MPAVRAEHSEGRVLRPFRIESTDYGSRRTAMLGVVFINSFQ